MDIVRTVLSGVLIIKPQRFGDARGWFEESWNADRMRTRGLDFRWVQDNHSFSVNPGTLRGLHYQAPPHEQAKLVRCTRGKIRDVVIDARKGSPSYGQWVIEELSSDSGRQLFIPEGFLHGFVTCAPDTEVQYKVTDFYEAEADGSVRWDSLGIDWGITTHPILSEKDKNAPAFDSWNSPFTYEKSP